MLLPSILWLMLLPLFFFLVLLAYVVRWQMLLPLYVVDGKPQICLYVMLADVIAMVVDGTTTQGGFLFGRCYSHGGRWNYHWSAFISILVPRCSTEPHPICVADGTCLHFYSGMDY